MKIDLEPIIQTLENMHQTDLALKILHEHSEKFTELSEIYGMLDPSITSIEKFEATNYINRIIKMGNWFDLIAYLYTSGTAKRELLQKFEIGDLIIHFRTELKKRLKESPLLATHVQDSWQHLNSFQP